MSDVNAKVFDINRDINKIEEATKIVAKYGYDLILKPSAKLSDVQGSGAQIQQEVVALIRKNGEPMHIREIFGALADNGVTIGGKVPMKTLSARLSASSAFISVRKGYWGGGG